MQGGAMLRDRLSVGRQALAVRAAGAVIGALLLGGGTDAVQAQKPLPGGCFARDYTPRELARRPDQVVDRLSLFIRTDPVSGGTAADLAVVLADQGHAGRDGLGGAQMVQSLVCWQEAAPRGMLWRCGVGCDGGGLKVMHQDGEVLEIMTKGLLVGGGEGCGGRTDLAEAPGKPVTYRLFRAGPEACGR